MYAHDHTCRPVHLFPYRMEVTGDKAVQLSNGKVVVNHRSLVPWMDLVARNPKNALPCVTNRSEVIDTEQNLGPEMLAKIQIDR